MTKLAALTAICVLVFVGCGSNNQKPMTTGTVSSKEAKSLFVENCGSCHTLSRAGSKGQVGPNLDQTMLDSNTIAAQITIGGGGMPAFDGRLSKPEIQALADYVAGSTK